MIITIYQSRLLQSINHDLKESKRIPITDIDSSTDQSTILRDTSQEHLILSGDIETNPGPTMSFCDVNSSCLNNVDPDHYDLKSQCVAFMLFSKNQISLQSLNSNSPYDVKKTLHNIQGIGFNKSLRELVKLKNFF